MGDTSSVTVGNDHPPGFEGSDAYNQEMAKSVEEQDRGLTVEREGGEPGEAPGQRPAKFKSDEDWRKSYDSLEKSFHEKNQPEPAETKDSLEIGDTPDPAQIPKLDMDKFTEEFQKSGTLDETSFKSLEEAGIPRAMANTYMQGVMALGREIGSTVKTSVGGEETYGQMIEWAKANYTPDQVATFDQAVKSGDVNQAMQAAKALRSDYVSSEGAAGETFGGPKEPDGGADTFQSNAQVVEAMRDTRYETDPAYREEVLMKLERSEVFEEGRA